MGTPSGYDARDGATVLSKDDSEASSAHGIACKRHQRWPWSGSAGLTGRGRVAAGAAIVLSLLNIDAELESLAGVYVRPDEEVGVVLVAVDPERVQRRDPAVDDRDVRLRQGGGARHHVHVAHGRSPADRDVEQGGSDAPGQHSPFEGRAPVVRDVEDRLVHRGLEVQPHAREEELLVRLEVGGDPRIDGWTPLVDADRGVPADGVRRDDVRALMRQDAGREARSELLPIMFRTGALARA